MGGSSNPPGNLPLRESTRSRNLILRWTPPFFSDAGSEAQPRRTSRTKRSKAARPPTSPMLIFSIAHHHPSPQGSSKFSAYSAFACRERQSGASADLEIASNHYNRLEAGLEDGANLVVLPLYCMRSPVFKHQSVRLYM